MAGARLILTEPTVSGHYHPARVAALPDHFPRSSPASVTKANLHRPKARSSRRFCDDKGDDFWGHLPFTPAFNPAQVEGKTILAYNNN